MQSTDRTCRAVALLVQAARRLGLDIDVDHPQDEMVRVGNRRFIVRVLGAPPVPSRIIDCVKVHLLDGERQRDGKPLIGREDGNPADELLVIVTPRLPIRSNVLQHLHHLVQEPAWRSSAWVVVSERGGAWIALPESTDVQRLDDVADDHPSKSSGIEADPLRSDVAMATLSYLLLNKVQNSRWRHPLAGADSTAVMARYIGASVPAVYAAISALEARHWVATPRGRLPEVIDVPGVVHWCLDHAKHRRTQRIAVRPMITAWTRQSHVEHWVNSLPEEAIANSNDRGTSRNEAVTGWAACRLHGLSVLVDPKSKPLELTLRVPVRVFVEMHGLVQAPDATTETLILSEAQGPLATFTGVTILHGVPVVDPWQAALHVASDPQRGIEQATAIADALWLAS